MKTRDSELSRAAGWLRAAQSAVAFTGAGVSVESGIPPFRGPGGLWSQYETEFIELGYFRAHPAESWRLIRQVFYDFMGRARPNPGHVALAALERAGRLQGVITQNIDGLHQEAGSVVVHECHGATRRVICLDCGQIFTAAEVDFEVLPPRCKTCGGLLKPDFVFFSEGLPEAVFSAACRAAEQADVMLVIGTTGEVMPACRIPHTARAGGCKIIEINVDESVFTPTITDVFLRGPAGMILPQLARAVLDAS